MSYQNTHNEENNIDESVLDMPVFFMPGAKNVITTKAKVVEADITSTAAVEPAILESKKAIAAAEKSLVGTSLKAKENEEKPDETLETTKASSGDDKQDIDVPKSEVPMVEDNDETKAAFDFQTAPSSIMDAITQAAKKEASDSSLEQDVRELQSEDASQPSEVHGNITPNEDVFIRDVAETTTEPKKTHSFLMEQILKDDEFRNRINQQLDEFVAETLEILNAPEAKKVKPQLIKKAAKRSSSLKTYALSYAKQIKTFSKYCRSIAAEKLNSFYTAGSKAIQQGAASAKIRPSQKLANALGVAKHQLTLPLSSLNGKSASISVENSSITEDKNIVKGLTIDALTANLSKVGKQVQNESILPSQRENRDDFVEPPLRNFNDNPKFKGCIKISFRVADDDAMLTNMLLSTLTSSYMENIHNSNGEDVTVRLQVYENEYGDARLKYDFDEEIMLTP